MSPLDPAEAAKLAEGWPLEFEADPDRLAARLSAAEPGGKHEVWRLPRPGRPGGSSASKST